MRALIILGFLTGIGSVAALAYSTPFLEHERVSSQTRVVTNGGRQERFEIRVNQDLLSRLPGSASAVESVPQFAPWAPELAPFTGDAEVYRLRNESGVVIGTAIRKRESSDVEWVLHLPARGTMVLTGLGVELAETGEMALGIGEFSDLYGIWDARLDEDRVWRFDTVVRNRAFEEELE